jgi:hypothetical protein
MFIENTFEIHASHWSWYEHNWSFILLTDPMVSLIGFSKNLTNLVTRAIFPRIDPLLLSLNALYSLHPVFDLWSFWSSSDLWPTDFIHIDGPWSYPLVSWFHPFDLMIISPWSTGSLPLIWWSYPLDLLIISPCIHDHKPFICWSDPDLKILSHWSDDPVPLLKESILCSNSKPILALSYLYRFTAKHKDPYYFILKLNSKIFTSVTCQLGWSLLLLQLAQWNFGSSGCTYNNPSTVVPAME